MIMHAMRMTTTDRTSVPDDQGHNTSALVAQLACVPGLAFPRPAETEEGVPLSLPALMRSPAPLATQ